MYSYLMFNGNTVVYGEKGSVSKYVTFMNKGERLSRVVDDFLSFQTSSELEAHLVRVFEWAKSEDIDLNIILPLPLVV